MSLMLAGLLCVGRHWISRWRWLRGGGQGRWSADYLQAYSDRWQIEVNHRDEKQQIGIADPQVWNDLAVDRQPAFLVAGYSFLLLAALEACGPTRTEQYPQPPPWQRARRSRPSCEDLLTLLRIQASERDGPEPGGMPFRYDPKTALACAAS